MAVAECPEPCALPIVFVPGIMGSRLRRRGGPLVWDPDNSIDWNPFAESQGSLAANALSGASAKRRALVGAPGQPHTSRYLQVDRGVVGGSLTQERIDRGWGGVFQGSYLGFLTWMDMTAQQPASGQVPRGCHAVRYEVFAHPYNWTDDNRTSAQGLARTVAQAVADTTAKWAHMPEVRILKPVLVTHSMGGLVARAYTQIRGGAGDVHGVIHGAMPTDGSPATYKRMLSGFEGVASVVLGFNQGQVTATAGNMPGALQLLPNSRHKSVDGSTNWLRLVGRSGNRRASYPRGDAYREIYTEARQWWRLIHERYLDPQGDPTGRAARAQSMTQIAKARSFDQALAGNAFHPNTRMFYSDDQGHLCWDKVEWRQTSRNDTPAAGQTMNNTGHGEIEWGEWVHPIGIGMGMPVGPTFVASTRYEIQDADAPGDATVHAGSGIHVSGPMSVATRRGFEHQEAYGESHIRPLMAEWLFDMVMEQL
ncbi:esterase/lipase family protein [Tateyamaria sp. SN6-1]|uniref:esterase/lipase family protein n=1 Tax=Tateyamaria sp. SN6-1 TaxID=3092148 RepID=UPI0039F55F02